ncbi:MAG TPA: vitamin K epoxide reductase family protein [Patescibacteria group bacterium]|nr:vitamin K epoxide reductase family protein [Patescibacteria group bacterium]
MNSLFLFIFSILGILNAYFLYWQFNRYVSTGQKMYCLMGEDCSQVVGSKYGRHFGIKNELTGIAYYLTIAIYSVAAYFVSIPQSITNVILVLSLFSVLFSIYLLFLQAVVLKKFCSWCLIAIVLNVVLFLLVFFH